MNCLYLSLINVERNVNSGIVKKIEGQIKAMKKLGLSMNEIFLRDSGLYVFYKDKEYLLKKSFFSKYEFIEKRIIYYRTILDFIDVQNIECVYIRYPLSDPFFIRFIKNCKKRELIIFLEIATYPYGKEICRLTLYIDKFFRKFLSKYVDYIVTYSDHDMIFDIKTIKISNGIDLSFIKTSKYNKNLNVINLIGVANVSFWHGYDRVIKGLHEYYKTNPEKDVYFHIVGEGSELNNLKKLTNELELSRYIIFHGYKTGKDLDELINISDIGIGSLGNHRKGMHKESALKNREYCSRGIPFILASKDEDFPEDFKYVYYIEQNDNPVKIKKIIDFYNSIKNENYINEMRKYAEGNLSWESKMKPVIEKILEKNK